MTKTSAENLRRYKAKMRAAGFRRLNVWVCAELVDHLDKRMHEGECRGRTMERLLLGEAAKRPAYPWTPEEKARRAASVAWWHAHASKLSRGRNFSTP